jgi:hypothetical protein
MDKLDDTGTFTEVVPSSQDRTDDGLFRALIESVYVGPPAAAAGVEATPAAATPAGERGTKAPAPSGAGASPAQPQRGGGRR